MCFISFCILWHCTKNFPNILIFYKITIFSLKINTVTYLTMTKLADISKTMWHPPTKDECHIVNCELSVTHYAFFCASR